jgi:large subunit ribosomal protein L22
VSNVATDDRMRVRAQAKWVRTSARKARLVLDHIRGRSVPEARTILAFTSRAVATDIEKVLRSAVANAEANHGLDGDELIVESAYADVGPTLKRWKPRARGRVNRIKKRTCHVTLVLVEQPEEQTRRRRRSATAETPAAAPVETPAAGETTTEQTTTAKKPTRRKKKTEGVPA